MKLKVKHRIKKSTKRSVKLNEINELSLAVFIIKRNQEDRLKERIQQLNAKVISITRGVGVSRNTIFESLKIGTDDVSIFFAASRVEDIRDLMQTITEEFELTIPGNGKGFVLDVDGYLGAKGLFIE